jgi:NAD(P)-dependent dehydrogenase (short-subunit alcohol dehydrogenase family)
MFVRKKGGHGMDLQLQGKRAFVSGSTAGIGYAIAELLATEGASVFVNGRTQDRTMAAVEKIRKAHNQTQVAVVAGDLSTQAGAQTVFDALPDLDILINNVGIFEVRPFEEIDDADWERFFHTNVMSGVRLSRNYLPEMLMKNWGRIIFISSESAVQIPPEMIHYGMTKTAQLAISRGLAELTAGSAVTVNSVLVGPTYSEGVGDFVSQMASLQNTSKEKVESDFFINARPTSLLKRFATPREVANMVVYLSSPLASATNGAAIRADGGVVKTIL